MIIVTGTKRSGTSMWMHVLIAAGLPSIGDRYPPGWGEALHEANPDGFFESELIAGINFQTNPHPATGAYLAPGPTRGHAVKVFIPGLVRTDIAYIDRCVATVRDWRAYVASSRRVRRMAGVTPGAQESLLPPALDWWCSNYGLVRDIAVRGYAAHVVTYDGLRREPARMVAEVIEWIGQGDAEAGAAVIDTAGRRPPGEASPSDADLAEGLEAPHLRVFDELYETLDAERPLSSALIETLNRTDAALRPRVVEHQARIHAQTVAQLLPPA
jgi:hypothetical protein